MKKLLLTALVAVCSLGVVAATPSSAQADDGWRWRDRDRDRNDRWNQRRDWYKQSWWYRRSGTLPPAYYRYALPYRYYSAPTYYVYPPTYYYYPQGLYLNFRF